MSDTARHKDKNDSSFESATLNTTLSEKAFRIIFAPFVFLVTASDNIDLYNSKFRINHKHVIGLHADRLLFVFDVFEHTQCEAALVEPRTPAVGRQCSKLGKNDRRLR